MVSRVAGAENTQCSTKPNVLFYLIHFKVKSTIYRLWVIALNNHKNAKSPFSMYGVKDFYLFHHKSSFYHILMFLFFLGSCVYTPYQ